jgi:hypothetical protein
MYQTRSEYDRGVNTFSPEGRLFQVYYHHSIVLLYMIFNKFIIAYDYHNIN